MTLHLLTIAIYTDEQARARFCTPTPHRRLRDLGNILRRRWGLQVRVTTREDDVALDIEWEDDWHELGRYYGDALDRMTDREAFDWIDATRIEVMEPIPYAVDPRYPKV